MGNPFAHTATYFICPTLGYGFVGVSNIFQDNENLLTAALLGLYQSVRGDLPEPEESTPLNLATEDSFDELLPTSSNSPHEDLPILLSTHSTVAAVEPSDFPETEWHHPFYGTLVLDIVEDDLSKSGLMYNALPMTLQHARNNVFVAISYMGESYVQFMRCPFTGSVTSVRLLAGEENVLFTSGSYIPLDASFKPNDAATQAPRVVKFVEPAVNNFPLALILGIVVGLVASGVVGGMMFMMVKRTQQSGEIIANNPLLIGKV
ncbi:hypothetical protein GEMRC1_003667 [Eukaryota sp. GEM-RC1]